MDSYPPKLSFTSFIMTNALFQPSVRESEIIAAIHKNWSKDYALIRVTDTMFDKSIIDASFQIREILRDGNIVDFNLIQQGEKLLLSVNILTEYGWDSTKSSFYRPKTKKGDPRFWIYDLKKHVDPDDLLYFTVCENELVVIPLKFNNVIERFASEVLKEEVLNSNLVTLISKLKELHYRGWIPSINNGKPADKDVGTTLETALNLPINNLGTADFFGEIELKCKRSRSKTRNTIFAQTPDWNLSKYNSAAEFVINYGIPSPKHPGFKTLYVTVCSSPPNNQGFYLFADQKVGQLHQNYMNIETGKDHKMCVWEFSKLKSRLLEKHPKTIWIEADETFIDGRVHFLYKNARLTQEPVFQSFINLIGTSEISLDWTHRVLPDGSKYNDHGFLFKIPTKSRPKLFGQARDIIF